MEQPHVVEWLRGHDAVLVDAAVSARFAAALMRLPWVGAALDWCRIGVDRVWLDAPDRDERVRRSWLGRHEWAFLVWSPDEPGVAGPLLEVVEDIDLLSWSAPGPRYLCGATRTEHGVTIAPEDFAEYNGGFHLRLRVG